MSPLVVDLGDRSYHVHVGRDLDPAADPALADGRPVVVLTDENVLAHHGRRVDRLLEGREGERIVVPAGERAKSFVCLEGVLERMASAGVARTWALVAFGGGVVGDLGGLAAALYMRGIDLIQVPTTLLSQVDAAIGGKTAVNLFSGKNLAGAFWQPRAVWSDVSVLGTLPRSQWASGLGETAKHALLDGPDAVEALVAVAGRIAARDPETVEEVVARSVAVKIRHVVADEREDAIRAHLNLGHTVGHAVEHAAGLPHGVAVGLGMLAEARLAEDVGVAEPGLAGGVERLLGILGLPSAAELPPATELVRFMTVDKKRARSGELAAVLLRAPGDPRIVRDLPRSAVTAAVETIRE